MRLDLEEAVTVARVKQPYRGGEPVEIESAPGVTLYGELLQPRDRPPRVGVALSHAMMVDRRTLDQPAGRGLLSQLVERGAAVLWFDQRGHGQSGPRASAGARWNHDQLVADVGAVASYLARRFPELPRVAVGHSLFGQVALAYSARVAAGSFMTPAWHRLALLGVNVWMRQCEPSRLRLLVKRASYATTLAVSRTLGYLPVRRLRLGTADEPHEYLAQMGSWLWRDDFVAGDGFSYLQALPRLRVPILSVAGDGDWLLGAPPCQLRLLSRTGGPFSHITVGRRFGYAADPDHMKLVLDERLAPMWREVADWVVEGPSL